MRLQITADGVPLQGTVENLLTKHLSVDLERSLKHYPDDIKKATVRVSKENEYEYRVTFEMQLPGMRVYSEESNKDLVLAVTKLRNEVKRQIIKHKEKQTKTN